MDTNETEQQFWDRLRATLLETSSWPSEYIYKFIIPTEETDKIAALRGVFHKDNAEITEKKSKTAKFTSLSVKMIIENPDEVIDRYKKTHQIKGIIAL